MAGTHSKYPESLDILSRVADGINNPTADIINIMGDAARQMEVTLGAAPITGNLPAGSASDWASLTTVQTWILRMFRMEFGTFEIDLPLAPYESGGSNYFSTDVNVYYTNPSRFHHTNSGGSGAAIPHFVGVTFDQLGGIDEVQGAVARQPLAHVNRLYLTTGDLDILGFQLSDTSWGNETYTESQTITGKYWAFEPQYHS